MNDKLKVYFAGSGRIAVPVLEALWDSEEIEVVGVGTQPDRPVGRKKVPTPTPLGAAAAQLGCVLHKFDNINAPEALDEIRMCDPQMIVVLSYGQLLKQPILELPPLWCINIHGSLLPRWRGASPIQQVLLNSEKETGVCFMQMERGLDSGPVFSTFAMSVPDGCGADELEMLLGKLAAEKCAATLLSISSGELKSVPQDHEQAVICRKITREDGAVRWEESAQRIEAMSRAYENWPGAYFKLRVDGAESVLTINSAKVTTEFPAALPGTLLTPGSRKKMVIACGENALEILSLTPAGRKCMPVSAFLNGIRGENIEFLPGITPDNTTL